MSEASSSNTTESPFPSVAWKLVPIEKAREEYKSNKARLDEHKQENFKIAFKEMLSEIMEDCDEKARVARENGLTQAEIYRFGRTSYGPDGCAYGTSLFYGLTKWKYTTDGKKIKDSRVNTPLIHDTKNYPPIKDYLRKFFNELGYTFRYETVRNEKSKSSSTVLYIGGWSLMKTDDLPLDDFVEEDEGTFDATARSSSDPPLGGK